MNCPSTNDTRFRPLFIADWRNAIFVHFKVDPAELQCRVPLELDLYDGMAYISLVAFTQQRLRPVFGGRISEWMSLPLATHDFLNVRTYVRHGHERGIYFLSEWIPNPLAVYLGPRLYGLPYRLGELKYTTTPDGQLHREVSGPNGRISFHANVHSAAGEGPCVAESESAFLLERYTAFTCRHHVLRRFRIRHEPWLQSPAIITIEFLDLPTGCAISDPCAAHFSVGVTNVSIGRPERLKNEPPHALNSNSRTSADPRYLH